MALTSKDEISPFLGRTVSLQIHPVGLIPGDFTRIKILSILSPEDVNADIRYLHQRVRSMVPDIPPTHNDYYYIKYRTPDSSVHFIGIPWIVSGTIAAVENRIVRVDVNVNNIEDAQLIRSALNSVGLNTYTITEIES